MHRLHSRYAVTRFKLASWALVFMYVMIPSTVGILIYSIAVEEKEYTWLGLCGMVATAVVFIFQWGISFRARCPLCHARSIARNGCAKHQLARPLLGSYRLRVACAVIFMECFRCPYCGESTAVKARPIAVRPRRRR